MNSHALKKTTSVMFIALVASIGSSFNITAYADTPASASA